jgi:hypothetical protein
MRIVAALVLLMVGAGACTRVTEHRQPACEPGSATTLMAESVMSAQLIPCMRSLPVGWELAGFAADDQSATFLLEARSGEDGIVEVALLRRCEEEIAGVPARSDEEGASLTQAVTSEEPYRATWIYEFAGGCTRYRIALALDQLPADHLGELRRSLSFLDRDTLADLLAAQGASPSP